MGGDRRGNRKCRKRQDLKCRHDHRSGPIVIGQGCEFDYSGTQAWQALREEGIRVVLLTATRPPS